MLTLLLQYDIGKIKKKMGIGGEIERNKTTDSEFLLFFEYFLTFAITKSYIDCVRLIHRFHQLTNHAFYMEQLEWWKFFNSFNIIKMNFRIMKKYVMKRRIYTNVNMHIYHINIIFILSIHCSHWKFNVKM